MWYTGRIFVLSLPSVFVTCSKPVFKFNGKAKSQTDNSVQSKSPLPILSLVMKKGEREREGSLLCSTSQGFIIGLIMMSILPAGSWLWKCTGFVLPEPDGADGAWHDADEQASKCVPPPDSTRTHTPRDICVVRIQTFRHKHLSTDIIYPSITHKEMNMNL